MILTSVDSMPKGRDYWCFLIKSDYWEKKMSTVLFAYGMNAFNQYLLPATDNADKDITLKKGIYGLKEDIVLNLEIVGGLWRLKSSEKYNYVKHSSTGETDNVLREGDVIYLNSAQEYVSTDSEPQIRLVVLEQESKFAVPQKYDVTKIVSLKIGNDASKNHIVYQCHRLVSREHAILEKRGDGLAIIDLSSNGVYVNGIRVIENKILAVGDVINIFGLKIVYMGKFIAVTSINEIKISQGLPLYNPNFDIKKKTKKGFFHRSPRNYQKLEYDNVEIEAPPAPKTDDNRPLWLVIGPSFTMMLPMLAGSALMIFSQTSNGNTPSPYMFTGMITAFGSAAVGVFWALTNIRLQKKSNKQNEENRLILYGQYLDDREKYINSRYVEARSILSNMYPSAKDVIKYDYNSAELWNRNANHEDFLAHRIGLGTTPFGMSINVPRERFTMVSDALAEKPMQIKRNYSVLNEAPINVDLLERKLIGIVGGAGKKGAYDIVRILSSQIAACDCYTDVKLVYIYDRDKDDENWEYTRWLPHVWSEDKKTRYVAGDKSEASDVFFELTQILRMRAEGELTKKESLPRPYYILIVSDMELLNGELISKYMFDCNSAYGLSSIILSEYMEDLPNECEFVIENDDTFAGIRNLADNTSQEIAFDSVTSGEVESFARKLINIEVKETEKSKDVPETVDFFEMYNCSNMSEFRVADKWRKNRNYENMRALVGLKGGGEPCYLDVHEKYHGPHGLVAGTTGSGKSETLQTYMLSLAIEFSPNDIGYFIIDYKGGGMAGLFEGLPHMIGSISNLSGNQVRRAMVSIKSENNRRMRIFKENGVNNINNYTKLVKSNPSMLAIPHLFIIIDEFAELKREEPEFMKELISVAQVGRSLGVHLILATQKPSGTVDENIWSNSKFRLCLRVQDKQDSKDMLHKPDAAYITQSGRGYLQVGNDEVYELFQSGYSGATYNPSGTNKGYSISMLNTIGRVVYSPNVKTIKAEVSDSITQLEAIKRHLAEVAKVEGFDHQMQLWMPLLPTAIHMADLNADDQVVFDGDWKKHTGEWRLSTAIGLLDDPVNQAQYPVYLDFTDGGHIAVLGSITSGKSIFMQSAIYGLISKYSPDWLNLYILDFSSQMLLCFEDAPHVGGVMTADDGALIEKFFFMMDKIIAERKQKFRGGNYSQYVMKNGMVESAIVVCIDNLGSFREKTDMRYDDNLMRLAKEGMGYGIYLMLTAADINASELTYKLADNIKTIFSIQMNDASKYRDVMRTNKLDVIPETGVKGRGLVIVNDIPLEYQTVLSVEAENDFERGARLKAISEAMAGAWSGKNARPIPVIPEKPVWREFAQLDSVTELNRDNRNMPIGYNSESAEPYCIDLAKTYSYIISGRARTGKTTALKAVICAAAMKSVANTVVIEIDGTDLAVTSERLGVRYINKPEDMFRFFGEIYAPFIARNKRKNELIAQGLDEVELFEIISKEFEPIYIICSDLSSFINTAYMTLEDTTIPPIKDFIKSISTKGKGHGIYFFMANNPENSLPAGIPSAAANGFIGFRTGIHLGGNASSIRYFDFNLSYNVLNATMKPGTGIIPVGNESDAKMVIIPNVKGNNDIDTSVQ